MAPGDTTEQVRTGGVRSTAHVLGHPIHPILIPFPIAFLTAAALTDIAYVWNGDVFWSQVSLWLIAAGVVTGAAAALFGLIDFVTIERARAHATGWVHFLGNAAVLVISLANWLLRLGDPAAFVQPWGVTLSLTVAALLVVTGWMGGELSYRHQIGVTGH